MKVFPGLLAASILLVGSFTSVGCGDRSSSKSQPADAAGEGLVSEVGTPEKPREVLVEVGDSMKFSRTRLEAKTGETLRLKLVNTGSAAKEVMGHNWVLLRREADVAAFANAALKAKANDYVPAELGDLVIAHTKLIGGKSQDTIVFTLPDAPGAYPFVCTFPAHFQLGMKGELIVSP